MPVRARFYIPVREALPYINSRSHSDRLVWTCPSLDVGWRVGKIGGRTANEPAFPRTLLWSSDRPGIGGTVTDANAVLERLIRIAQEHLCYAAGHPGKLASIAVRLSIPKETALAYAIADQICEEFTMTPRG